MNTPGFIPENLKAARQLLGMSQQELGDIAGMPQKDISLHENKTSKTLIPVRYMLALYSRGIDLNSLFREGEVRKREAMSMAAEPSAAYHTMRNATGPERQLAAANRLRDQLLDKLMTPEKLEALMRLLEKEERSAPPPPGEPGDQGRKDVSE